MSLRARVAALAWCLIATVNHADAQDAAGPARSALPAEVTIAAVEFVRIPAGWFWYIVENGNIHLQKRGSPMYRQVRVWLDDFYLAKYEARARDYASFLNANPPPALEGPAPWLPKTDEVPDQEPPCSVLRGPDGAFQPAQPDKDWPATNLDWPTATRFAKWMGFRLPTEAEWQKGARGTDRRIWPWGDDYPDDTYAHFSAGRGCNPLPVDSLPKGRSPYGLHHMAGNVGEFTQDWYNEHWDRQRKDGDRNPPLAEEASPIAFSEPAKLSKGGRWSMDAYGQSIAQRRPVPLKESTNRDGVRFAVDADVVRALLSQGAVAGVQVRTPGD